VDARRVESGARTADDSRAEVRYKSEPPIYEFYDLDADPDELSNVADGPEYLSDRSELEAALDRLLAS
jgi:hypothetical protein